MKKCLIIGASGYTGAQLTQLILQHPQSEHSGAGGFEPQFVAQPIICQRIPTIRLCFSSKQSYISVDGRYWTDANVD